MYIPCLVIIKIELTKKKNIHQNVISCITLAKEQNRSFYYPIIKDLNF